MMNANFLICADYQMLIISSLMYGCIDIQINGSSNWVLYILTISRHYAATLCEFSCILSVQAVSSVG